MSALLVIVLLGAPAEAESPVGAAAAKVEGYFPDRCPGPRCPTPGMTVDPVELKLAALWDAIAQMRKMAGAAILLIKLAGLSAFGLGTLCVLLLFLIWRRLGRLIEVLNSVPEGHPI